MSFEREMMDMEERIIARKAFEQSNKQLWDLYLACLSGWHSNDTANVWTNVEIAEKALNDARGALKVWKEQIG